MHAEKQSACTQRCNQHAIRYAISMQSECNQHAISMQSACNQLWKERTARTRPSTLEGSLLAQRPPRLE